MEKENLMKTVAANLRSVTQSSKGGVPLDKLQTDYMQLLGKPIPFSQMGFNSLDSLLRSMPDVVKLVRDNATRKTVVMAVADESTAHIAKMIARQRDTKSRHGSKQRFRIPYTRYQPEVSRPATRLARPLPPLTRKVNLSSPSSRTSQISEVPSKTRTETAPKKAMRDDLASKKSITISATNFEVPPRFLRTQKIHVTSEGRETVIVGNAVPVTESPTPPAPSKVEAKPSPPHIRSPVQAPSFPQQYSNSYSAAYADGDVAPQSTYSPNIKQPKIKRAVAAPPPLPVQLTAKQLVEEYAKKNNLKIEFKTKLASKKDVIYYSVLLLGDQKFHSIRSEDREKHTQSEAEELAASLALEHIEEENRKMFPMTALSSVDSIHSFVSRIETIVSEKPSGIWSTGMQREYELRYKESLPLDWLSVMEQNSSVVEIHKPEGLNVPKNASILRIVKPSSGATTPTSTSSRASVCLDDDQQFLPHFTECGDGAVRVPLLVLPERAEWSVYVCCVESTVNVCIRFIDYCDQFEEMVRNLNTFYSTYSTPVHKVIRSKPYVAFDEGSWHRVSVEDVLSDGKVLCYFVDNGCISEKQTADLRELDPRFEVLPFQAVHIKLYGLDDYVQIIRADILEGLLLDRALIAKVEHRQPDIAVELFDTSGEDDINLNEQLKVKMFAELFLSATLSGVDLVTTFCLINVSENGVISLVNSKSGVAVLESELEKLSPKFEARAGRVSEELQPNRMYAAKYPIDDAWCRAYPTGTTVPATGSAPYEVEMYFVDYGNMYYVPLSSIAELEPWLAELPCLAQQCVLTGVPPLPDMTWTERATSKLYELVPDTEELLVRVDEAATEENPAKVHLFIRGENGVLMTINDTLAFSTELFSGGSDEISAAGSVPISPPTPPVHSLAPDLTGSGNANTSSHPLQSCIPDVAVPAAVVDEQIEKLYSVSIRDSAQPQLPATTLSDGMSAESNPIPAAEIPTVGNFFDVYIAMAASPSNFVVQPLKSGSELTNLLLEMRKFYSSEENTVEMHLCLLGVGEYYAVHHKDNEWYRARLVNIVGDDMIMVYLIDFGDFVMTNMSTLQPLWNNFRSFPYQAIKASLSGVKPVSSDWDPEHCLEFRKQVEEKAFVSIVTKKRPCSESDYGECILELTLIDTSDKEKDVYISDLLIQRNWAVKA